MQGRRAARAGSGRDTTQRGVTKCTLLHHHIQFTSPWVELMAGETPPPPPTSRIISPALVELFRKTWWGKIIH